MASEIESRRRSIGPAMLSLLHTALKREFVFSFRPVYPFDDHRGVIKCTSAPLLGPTVQSLRKFQRSLATNMSNESFVKPFSIDSSVERTVNVIFYFIKN